MSQAVIIKSSKYGINLVLDSTMPFGELLEEILQRFQESEKFFANASFALSFEGRALTEEEKNLVVDTIMSKTNIRILCIIDENEIRDAIIKQKLKEEQERQIARQKISGSFYYGNLAAGEQIETAESIVIVGDVPADASVVSQSDVVILGELRGRVFAGMSGKEDSFIAALDFAPETYNIAGVYGEPVPKSKSSIFSKRNKTSQAMIATVCDGIINVRPFT